MTGSEMPDRALDAIAHRKRVSILLLYIAIALPFIAQAAMRAMQTNANSPVDWVSDAFPAKANYESFRKQFGTGDVVVMGWPSCTLDNKSLDNLLASLRTAPAFHDEQQQSWFERVSCGREEVEKLTRPPTSLPPATVLARLRGTLVGQNGNQTCVVVAFNSAGLAKRSLIVPRLRMAVERFCQVPPNEIHMAGPVMDGLTVDRASKAALDQFAPLSSLIVLGLCWICLDSLPMALLVFSASLLCQAATLAIISWCGDTMSALLIVMPPLIQVLAVAGGVHFANYYFDESRRADHASRAGHASHASHASHAGHAGHAGRADRAGHTSAVVRAFRLGWLPCALSSATTAIGLGSLLVSRLVPVRAFGAYAAAGVSVTMAVLLTVIPGVLLLWPVRVSPSSKTSLNWDGWSLFMRWVAKHHVIITSAALLGMAIAAVGTTRLQTSVQIQTLFGADSRLLADYRWLESHVGPMVPLEVIVACDENCQLSFQDRLRLVTQIQDQLHNHPQIDSTTSAVSFLPAVPQLTDADPRSKHFAMSSWTQAAKVALVDAKYLAVDQQESYRVTGYTSALKDVDFGIFLDEISDQVEPLLRKSGQLDEGVAIRFTGIMPLVHDIQRQLLEDLFASFLTAFVVIAIVMTLVQGGICAGIAAMIPNVFPTLLLFGVLGWQDVAMDIGSVMTASVALGIAVDDTLHFLTFYRLQINTGATRFEAVLFACRHCGKAMLQTTLICGLGLLAFALADFVPTARFAWMMLILLLLALVGDLVVLPALLLSPVGRLFADAPRSLSKDAIESLGTGEPGNRLDTRHQWPEEVTPVAHKQNSATHLTAER